jgi:hypothetical protein
MQVGLAQQVRADATPSAATDIIPSSAEMLSAVAQALVPALAGPDRRRIAHITLP